MIIVSGCLAGINCKYNGGNNYDERICNLVRAGKAIVVCPEQMGGLKTPRKPAEIRKSTSEVRSVVTCEGDDVTEQYFKGAEETLKIAQMAQATAAILQPRSPSCGRGTIYDGTFSKTKIDGNGITAELLLKNGIEVYSPDEYFNKI